MIALNYIINYTTIGPILIFLGIIFLILGGKWKKALKIIWNLTGKGAKKWIRN